VLNIGLTRFNKFVMSFNLHLYNTFIIEIYLILIIIIQTFDMAETFVTDKLYKLFHFPLLSAVLMKRCKLTSSMSTGIFFTPKQIKDPETKKVNT
jgi:hypothetical protein